MRFSLLSLPFPLGLLKILLELPVSVDPSYNTTGGVVTIERKNQLKNQFKASMKNLGLPSPSAAANNTPMQPISSSTPLVPSFTSLLGTTGVPPGIPTETWKRGRPEKHATESFMSTVMTTPSPSQVIGGGLSSPMQPQEDGAHLGMTTSSPFQVVGGGLSSPMQLQEEG